MNRNTMLSICIACLVSLTVTNATLAPSASSATNAQASDAAGTHKAQNGTSVAHAAKATPKTTSAAIQQNNSCPCVVFRLDDIQEYYLDDVQMKLIEEFQKKNASLSIGVIGYGLPSDANLASFLKENLKPGHTKIELTNHGWKHEDFSTLSKSIQVSLMNMTNQELLKMFGKKPDVFITPYNLYNNDTLKAVKQLNMKTISSGIWRDDKFVTTLGKVVANKDSQGLYHVPSMTDFQVDIGHESYWTSIPKDKVIASINSHLLKYGYDVVLLHPENFAVYVNGQYANTVNTKYMDEISSIIDYVKSKHIKITTLSEIANLDHGTVPAAKKATSAVSAKTASTASSKVPVVKQVVPSSPPKVTLPVEPTGSLTLNMKYSGGDRVGAYETSLKIYQDFDAKPYMELPTISRNPFVVTSLPLYHQYKVLTYVGGMLSSTNLVTLDEKDQDLDITVPDGGSMQVAVYYNDGQTPIPDASVSVRTQDNKTRDTGITDVDGLASRFYLPSAIVPDNYYVVDAQVNNHLKFSSVPIMLQSGDARDVKLVTPWPPVVQNLITVTVYNKTALLSTPKHIFAVEMYDSKGNQVAKSPINIHGEGYFWSMKIGDYVFRVVNTSNGEILGNLSVTIDGAKNNFNMIIQKHASSAKEASKI